MACCSATGVPAAPLLIFQGIRPFSKFTQEWPECPFAMDSKGYMTREIFFSWAVQFEEETRPADPDEPRCLFLDNHYSHFAVDIMSFLRAHNVRVVALHPHTTHILCALDCGILRSFKAHFVAALHDTKWAATIVDVARLVKIAWDKAMTTTTDPVTKKVDGVAIRAFARVGLVPFNPNVVDEAEFGFTEQFKAENAGGEGKKVARITLSDEELAKRRADILSDYKKIPADVAAACKRAPRTQMAEIYTYSGTLMREAEKGEEKEAEETRKKNTPWALAGLSYKVYKKQEAARKAAEASAEREKKAAEKAATKAKEAADAEAAEKAKVVAKAAVGPKQVKAKVPKALPVAPPPPPPQVIQRGNGKRGVKRPRSMEDQ